MRRLAFLLLLLSLTLLSGSAIEDSPGFQGRKTVAIDIERVDVRGIAHARELRPLAGWILSSRDADFGGLSALSVDGRGFSAVADTGALVRFSRDLRSADIRSFPRICVPHLLKKERDSESLARDARSGKLWIGFEWRNAICRIDPDGRVRRYAPPAMRYWPKSRGPEAMIERPDGRFLVFGERSPDEAPGSPLLLFDRDPTDPAAHITPMRYQAPPGYDPTDAAMLPDGRILVVNRRFSLPFSFATIVTLVPPFAERPGLIVRGRPVVSLTQGRITDNFEGIAISEREGRTFVWLVSDDNFLPYQETYLLKFELVPNASSKAALRSP